MRNFRKQLKVLLFILWKRIIPNVDYPCLDLLAPLVHRLLHLACFVALEDLGLVWRRIPSDINIYRVDHAFEFANRFIW